MSARASMQLRDDAVLTSPCCLTPSLRGLRLVLFEAPHPHPRIAAHFRKAEARAPAQPGCRVCRVGVTLDDIARPAWRHAMRYRASAGVTIRIEHFEHRI